MLIPYNVDTYLYYSKCIGNMGINGVWLDIYNKRNLFYFSLFILYISYLLNYCYFGLICCICALYLYVKCCNKWYNIIIIRL